MTFESMLLIAQTTATFFLAAWLTTGVLENIFFPRLNSAFTAEVLDMKRLREQYPEAYQTVAHRRVENHKVQTFLFRLIVFWESLSTLSLWVGFVALILANFGQTAVETSRVLAMFGVLLFTATWAGFLVAGNWFCYWFCHEGAQNTHYQMTLWGLATMILLAIG